jgi:two-component system chemotaxis sensor kinase CheA
MSIKVASYLRLFVGEASDHAEAMGKLWPRLTGPRFEVDAVDELFRHAHSIKGMSATMGFEEIVEVARAAEQLLGEIHARRVCLPGGADAGLFRASDLMLEMIRRRGKGKALVSARSSLVIADIVRLIPEHRAPSSEESPAAVEELEEALKERLRTVRVRTEALDGLLDTAGELLLGVSRLRELGKRLTTVERSQLEEGIARLHGGVRELHGQIVKARLTPLSVLTDRLPQHVREVARRTSRQVDLGVTGSEIEVDRAIVDGLADILLHLLRNCVDHGVESPDERLAAGKPPAGRLTVDARREQDQLVLEVADDGRGFDLEGLRLAAVKAGRIDLRGAQALSEGEVLMLACLPGVSTAAQVTDISGRGIGLDAVKAAAEALGGTFTIDSVAGQGSRFRLGVPLTVALIQVLLAEVDGETVALPLSRIVAAVELAPGRPAAGIDHVLGFAPLHSLSRLLGWSDRPAERGLALLWQLGDGLVALQIDRLLGQQEAVLKPVSPPLDRLPGVSAVTLLGTGRPVFILDVPRLLAA